MWPERQPVQPRKKDSPKYISLIAFSHTFTHTSSYKYSLVSHQLNFLSQIIFHFPEATQNNTGKKIAPTHKNMVRTRLEKDSSLFRPQTQFGHEKPCPSVSTLKFIIYNFLQSSCPHLSLTFLRWRPLLGLALVSS